MRRLTITQRVPYAYTDRMGVVYYAYYLVWMEIARTELFRRTGYTYDEMEKDGYYLPVVRVECDYKSPAKYDDVINITVSVGSLGKASVSFLYRILRKKDGRDLARAKTVHACVDKNGKVTGIEPKVRKLLD